MATSRVSEHKPSQPEQPRREADPSPHEEVLAWEHLGDDLWLPRRVRGSFRGGALG
jgi:hypothetical protein